LRVEGSGVVTLLVRHLPEAIPFETLTRLFSHYGAASVRHCSHGRLVKNCAFVDFNDESLASIAQRQMHGLRFLGKVLSVERAFSKHHDGDSQSRKDLMSGLKDAYSVSSLCSSDDSREFHSHAAEPIAKKLGVEYPFPPHLEYAYPPPDAHILTNIVNALIAVPRFYTQVLHLMNKMSIPAPFGKALPTPSLPLPIPVLAAPPPQLGEAKSEGLSSGEPEIESSDEEMQGEPGPAKKRVKRQVIVGPAIDKNVDHEAVGLKQVSLVPKEKPIIKKKNPILQIKIASKQSQPSQKDDVAEKETVEPSPETSRRENFATLEELNTGKLPPEEILSLPRFKNYAAGDPSSVLYIKNLAKDVVVEDFYFIFGYLFGSIDAAKSNLSVKLMREGRMRDQAFVTFPSIDLARNALNVVNGYVLKGKPVVIQFGRAAKAS
ncbi:hypothetical protein M569_09472, partial [Genlisea aurea]